MKNWLFIQFIVLCISYSFSPKLLAEQNIEIISLSHQSAEQIITSLQPFIGVKDKLSNYNNQIIIQSTPNKIKQLKAIISKLDVATTKLLVSVSHGHAKPDPLMTVDSEGKVKYGLPEQDSFRDREYSTSKERDRQLHHIRVDSGFTAHIKTGVTIPLIQHQFAASNDFNLEASLTNTEINKANSNSITAPATSGVKILKDPLNGQTKVTQDEILRLSQIKDSNPASSSPSTSSVTLPDPNVRIEIAVPTTTNLPINIPEVTDQSFSLSESISNGNKNLNANKKAQEQYKDAGKTVNYHHLENGITIRPIVLHNKVKVEVLTRNDKANKNYKHGSDYAYSTYDTVTSITIPFNTWVYFGGNRTKEDLAQDGYRYHSQAKQKGLSHLWIRIDQIPD